MHRNRGAAHAGDPSGTRVGEDGTVIGPVRSGEISPTFAFPLAQFPWTVLNGVIRSIHPREGNMAVEFLDARQRDERRFKKIAIFSLFLFLSVLAAYALQWMDYFDLTIR
jgi:hypothetical protein